jgi:HSP20 family molecular chaperone IbpA
MKEFIKMMDEFEEFFTHPFFTGKPKTYNRTYEWVDAEDRIEFKMILPGIPKDKVKIRLEEKALKIIAERDGKDIEVSVPVKSSHPELATAALKDGVLTITFPRGDRFVPREIPIT